MQLRACRLVSLTAVLFLSLSAFAEDLAVPPLLVQPINENQRTVLMGNTHPLARPEYDRGPAPADLPMNRMLLVLKRSNQQESALLTLLNSQQDKSAAGYHKWLTPELFGEQFGPADQDIQTVTKWLRSHGFQIDSIAKGRNLIEFSGVASQVQEAFHTSIHKFVVNGEDHWANASDPSIPTALAPVVAGVHTLHNFLKKPMLHISQDKIEAKLEPQGPGKPPLLTFPGSPPVHALGPADFATIYNINPLYHLVPPISGGGGIAVIARSNIDDEDISDFDQVFGLANQPYKFGYIQPIVNGPDPGDLGGGEEAEAMLDATWASAVAPGTIVYRVVSASTNTTDGVDLSEAYIVDHTIAGVMTESFGTCEASVTSTEAEGFATLAEQAAAQGVTYLVSSGDSGAEGCDNPNFETTATGPLSVNALASTPFTLAVGGTMFNENGEDSKYWNTANNQYTLGSAVSYIPEDVWNESCTQAECGDNAGIWAGGGGASTFFAKPSWQSGVEGIPNDGARDVPDVALTAAGHDPYLICLHRSCVPNSQGYIQFLLVSGTSAAAPSFAGIMALVDQKMNGTPQGHAGYVLYKLAATENLSSCNASKTSGLPASTCIFNDVTSGNNAVPGEKGYGEPNAQYQSSVGYDLTTGLGSVNVTNLVNKWSTVTFRPTLTNLAMSPTTITHGQPVNFTATVTPQSGTGTPTGDVDIRVGYAEFLGLYSLSGGTVSSTVTAIPGGTWTIEAEYAGDEIFAPSGSNGVLVQVTPEPSTTTLRGFTLNNNYQFVPLGDIEYGTFAYLRADVKGQSGNGVPTGKVTFTDTFGSIAGNPFALNGQGNTETPNFLNSPLGGPPVGLYTLALGSHLITAGYNGDPSFNASTSTPINFAVVPASTKPALQFTPGAAQGGTFAATINTNSGGTPPTGTVTFIINGKQIGPATPVKGTHATTDPITGALVPAQATATYTDSGLANGSYSIKSVYNGDQNYIASTSASMDITLQPDFTIAAQPTAVAVASPGASESTLLTVTGSDGFTGKIDFSATSCSGLPAGASCTFSPTSVTANGSVIVTVTTTAATSGSLLHRGRRHAFWAASGGIGLACLFLLGAPRKRRPYGKLLPIAVWALLVLTVACGGGSSGGTSGSGNPAPPSAPGQPTPSGSYQVTITATSGSLSHKLTFTLNVG